LNLSPIPPRDLLHHLHYLQENFIRTFGTSILERGNGHSFLVVPCAQVVSDHHAPYQRNDALMPK
jgi:hypothetical protein